MKKVVLSLILFTLTAFTLNAQEVYNQPFTSDLGDVITFSVTGEQVWVWDTFDNGCAKMSGFSGGTEYANEDWLITPALDFTSQFGVVLNFREAINYEDDVTANEKILVSTDYTGSGDPNNATWTELTVTGRASGGSWDFVDVDPVDLSAYEGESAVYIGFRYASSSSAAGTWEIGEIVVSTAGADTTPPTLVSATATSEINVRVTFSEKVSEATAEVVDNYSIDLLTVSNAELQSDEKSVVLTTSEQTPAVTYTLTVNNVEDLAGNPIEPNNTIEFTGYSPGGEGENVFFSEYIEGSSQNKALEIYNGTDSEINLANYRIAQSTNGNGWQYWHTFPDGASIASGDVWVITTDEADAQLQAVADEIVGYPSVAHFNGNDARGLEKTTDGGGTWTLIDVIGVPTEDPGDGWDVAGTPAATKDHTLVRKAEITEGNTDWSASAGTNADNSEWIVYGIDTFNYLGWHEAGADTTPPTLVSATATSEINVRVTFSEKVSEATAEVVGNYSIEELDVLDATLQPDEKSVVLTTSEQTPGETYTLTVSNVEDLAGNPIEPNSTITFTGYSPGEYDLIADIQANPDLYDGQEVTICGVVTIGVNIIQTERTNAYVQDNSGRGINIYSPNVIEELQRGNLVEITGIVKEYIDSYGDPTTEITNPVVTVIDTGYPEPLPLVITFNYADSISLEGTLVQITGEIGEINPAGGGTNINLTDELGNTFTVRVWDTTGLDLEEFSVGDILRARGVASVYSGKLQILPGYQDHLQLTGLVTDYFDIIPAQPQPDDSVTVIFTCPDDYIGECDSVMFNWHTVQHLPFQQIEMLPVEKKSSQYYVTLPGQPAGTTVYFYVAITDTSTGIEATYPEGAPRELESFSITPLTLTASLKVPPRTFCPSLGEKIEIQVHARKEQDKVILRLYNSEGNLVHTFFNKVSKGSETIIWDGKDESWNTLPPGLYICHLEVIDRQSGKKKTDIAPIVIAVPLKN